MEPTRAFSRYRRQARSQTQQQPPPPSAETEEARPPPPMPLHPAVEPQNEAPISRSMSRYHRRPPATSTIPAAKAPPLRPDAASIPRYRALSSPHTSDPPHVSNISRTRTDAAPSPTARDEARQIIRDEAERHRRIKEKQEAEHRARIRAELAERERQDRQRKEEEEAERLRLEDEAAQAQARQQLEERERGKRLQKAESAKRIQQREEAELRARAEEDMRRRQQQPPPQSPPASPQRGQGGRFGMFRRREGGPASPGSTAESSGSSKPGDHTFDYIKAGGGGAVLGIDAPISAINAGDRRVSVVCNKKQFFLSVTPETTAHDLLKSAALCMTEAINPRTDIFVENFHKVGIQRPIRLYEHVRDIMNSWDSDMQNDLEIVNSSEYSHSQLVATEVPSAKPEGITCYLHHSSRPGKWYKKFVTLRSDGQLGLAKSEGSKDFENICHLSDFDIYTPTKKKQSKIKPPKKYCYAVKSQQKSNIFSDESRYVHFFSTNDAATAHRFHAAVQQWRSWHLKHVMGEGQKKKAAESKQAGGVLANAKALSCLEQNGTSSHNRNTSVGSFYQLGSFKPLFAADTFGKEAAASTTPVDSTIHRSNTKAMHARKMSTRGRAPPPAAFERSGALINDVPSTPLEPSRSFTESTPQPPDEAFATDGLLGRKYTQRQKAMQEREKKATGPFVEGPSLVGNIDALAAAYDSGLGRRASVRSTTHRRTSSDIQRSVSTRVKPKPLVDLTPQYVEPPQHRNKGKGFAPAPSSGPLVESATSVEEAIKVPPSTDWRRPATGRHHGTYGTGGHERTRSLKGRGEGLAAYAVNKHDGAPTDGNIAFTGGGLLAQAGFSQGHKPVGRGVMDGSKAKGPMLDMAEESQFASGSLLADVQRRQASGDRRQSVDLG